MEIVDLRTAEDWRRWLIDNGDSATEIWLVIHHKSSVNAGMRYHEAIEQALCFGWIDGLHRRHGAHSSQLRFTPRSARSSWSALNRERAQHLIDAGLMTEHGQTAIDIAKANGKWQALTADMIATSEDDLHRALRGNQPAREHFEGFPPSARRLIVEWIASAKRPETRNRRISRTVDLAAINIRANQ